MLLWRRPPQTVPRTAPVPDAEALRLTALQASWRRGQWVARRRLAWRWLLWFGLRYLLPALLVLGVGGGIWMLFQAGQTSPWQRLLTWSNAALPASPDAVPVSTPVPRSVPDTPLPTQPAAESPASEAPQFSPEGEELPIPLALKIDRDWNGANGRPSPGPTASPPTEPGRNEPYPTLQPENWLHSKEP